MVVRETPQGEQVAPQVAPSPQGPARFQPNRTLIHEQAAVQQPGRGANSSGEVSKLRASRRYSGFVRDFQIAPDQDSSSPNWCSW